jgi:LPS export ABC transporter protein LptC
VAAALVTAAACRSDEPPVTQGAPADSADQVLFGMVHNVTVDGLLRARVYADTAHFYQGAQVAELVGVKVDFFNAEGVLKSTVTSLEGTYEWRTGTMEARGDVLAVTPDDRQLTTSTLRYDRETEQISGPDEFVFDGPDQHLEGDGFTADPDFTNVVTENPRRGRVRETDTGR